MAENEGTNCPIFQKQEPGIIQITDGINMAKTIFEKIKWAEALKQELNVLLSCMQYNKRSTECNNCISIANLRNRTATLIIKTKPLV